MEEQNNIRPDTRVLKGSEVLVLDDPSSVWIVESGSVALFGVALRHGAPDGPRRFFFSSESGEALFGLPRREGDGQPVVIAVALEDSTLRKGRIDRAGSGEAAGEWIRRWTECLGRAESTTNEAAGPQALDAFHDGLLDRIRQLGTREEAEERARLGERVRRSREVADQAVADLVAVLQPGKDHPPQGTELFVAASVVGRHVGIELRAPAAWEEGSVVSDPVEMIARTSHARVRRVVLHDQWWKQDCGPLLAFLGEERRPVALLPRSARGYRLFDPATGARSNVDRQVAARLDPQAYVFYRPLPDNASKAIELLKFALRGRGRDLAVVGATGVAATLLGMFTPQATALLIDYAIPDGDVVLLGQIGIGLVAAAFGIAVFRLSQGIAMMRVETGADVATQSAVWDRLLNLQLSFFRKFSTGDLQSRVTAVSQIRSYLGGTTLRTLFSSVIMLLNLFLLLFYSPTLTVVAVLVAALSGAVTVGSGALILRYARRLLELRGRFFGLMVQLINGVPKLRVAAAEERAFARWARDYSQLLRLELKQRTIQDTVRVLNIAISTLSAIALFAIAASLIRQDGQALTTGVFLAFSVAYGTFIGAIVSLSNTVTDVMGIAILRERAKPILDAVPEVNERKTDPGGLEGTIELQHVVFQYQDDGPIVLDDVSLRAEAGQFIALVGPSGSGKSTILRMLLGFESPQSGGIQYDGQDLAGLDVYAVRRQMGVVLQQGRINAGSLFDNIAAGSHVSLNDAWEAARATGFADEISAMPMGMHTVVSEGGTNLSGGQRQRMLLTRALVHKPSILLLDEATSALDNKTQAIVSESLQRLNVTRIVIAHRLSTIRHADRIYVIDKGRVVEQGAFAELAAQDGLFARLMARQLA